jgi:hypothetical protein
MKYPHLLLTVSVEQSILFSTCLQTLAVCVLSSEIETDMEVDTDTNQRQHFFRILGLWKMLVRSLV